MDPKIKELQERQVEIGKRMEEIQTLADGENRQLTEEEGQEFDNLSSEFDDNDKSLKRIRKLDETRQRVAAQSNRQTDPEPTTAQLEAGGDTRAAGTITTTNVTVGDPRWLSHGMWGYRNFGHMAQEVRTAALQGTEVSDRLQQCQRAALSTYGNEGAAQDGGFAVPPDIRSQIMSMIQGEDSLMARTDQQVSSSNQIVIPTDETTPWQTSGGIQAYWENEAGTMTQSKPNLQETNIKLNKLISLVPVTDELLEDAPALSTYLRRKVSEKMAFKTNLAIVQGTGVGQPLGLLNSPALVTVAKESSQAADTIVSNNIFKMWSRMYAPSRRNAVWLINQDIEPQLFNMTVAIQNVAGTENVGGSVVYLPANGLADSPFATLMGRPVIPTQACETIGDLGDIFFVDLNSYMTATRVGAVREDVSIHFWFDQAVTGFRFVMRMAGQPWWSTTASPRDGSNTLSPYVTLAVRS